MTPDTLTFNSIAAVNAGGSYTERADGSIERDNDTSTNPDSQGYVQPVAKAAAEVDTQVPNGVPLLPADALGKMKIATK